MFAFYDGDNNALMFRNPWHRAVGLRLQPLWPTCLTVSPRDCLLTSDNLGWVKELRSLSLTRSVDHQLTQVCRMSIAHFTHGRLSNIPIFLFFQQFHLTPIVWQVPFLFLDSQHAIVQWTLSFLCFLIRFFCHKSAVSISLSTANGVLYHYTTPLY